MFRLSIACPSSFVTPGLHLQRRVLQGTRARHRGSGAGWLRLAGALSMAVLCGGTARAQPYSDRFTHLPVSLFRQLGADDGGLQVTVPLQDSKSIGSLAGAAAPPVSLFRAFPQGYFRTGAPPAGVTGSLKPHWCSCCKHCCHLFRHCWRYVSPSSP